MQYGYYCVWCNKRHYFAHATSLLYSRALCKLICWYIFLIIWLDMLGIFSTSQPKLHFDMLGLIQLLKDQSRMKCALQFYGHFPNFPIVLGLKLCTKEIGSKNCKEYFQTTVHFSIQTEFCSCAWLVCDMTRRKKITKATFTNWMEWCISTGGEYF